jgi:hypothetical protein
MQEGSPNTPQDEIHKLTLKIAEKIDLDDEDPAHPREIRTPSPIVKSPIEKKALAQEPEKEQEVFPMPLPKEEEEEEVVIPEVVEEQQESPMPAAEDNTREEEEEEIKKDDVPEEAVREEVKEEDIPTPQVTELPNNTESPRILERSPSVANFSPLNRSASSGPPLATSAVTAAVRATNPVLDELLHALELLAQNDPSLTQLDLKDCPVFLPAHGTALADALKTNSHLEVLSLQNTKLQNNTAVEIAEVNLFFETDDIS